MRLSSSIRVIRNVKQFSAVHRHRMHGGKLGGEELKQPVKEQRQFSGSSTMRSIRAARQASLISGVHHRR